MFSNYLQNDPLLPNDAQLDLKRIPHHIAIIMDGNGRWAQKRHLPRTAGHKAALTTVKEITKAASDLGVKVLTLYTFSTENWKRPKSEVSFLMSLIATSFKTFMPELIANNVRVFVIGELTGLPPKTLATVQKAIKDTANNTGMILNFAINYGGRDELIKAAKDLATLAVNQQIKPEQIDEQLFAEHLMTAQLGQFTDPDLLIRTSGEERISNFLLWQVAYSEFVFSKVLWPDYSPAELKANIIEYQSRNRRFGGLKKE
ncbi:isoprenyl transferase [Liquorilactobacillus vini]|uniref:Isoprenyl transferase n=1 Tax=Liquorilactobacillus vini DSM 20605 TaxID=1133569 RepID=A0A0R2CEW7_9LACO|nr:isoprenyl transferase [Liquorilactobacillus vini]KRM89634.1 di-trans-poly-cis-decaprenylcistransferase [Liquorilactobacillus vini DSM 20605]